jgi:hypothetical protein
MCQPAAMAALSLRAFASPRDRAFAHDKVTKMALDPETLVTLSAACLCAGPAETASTVVFAGDMT